MRLAFHAINGVGLGHVVRVINIATEMRAIAPDARLLVFTNARDTSLLERAKLDFVQLPPRLSEPHTDPDRSLHAFPEHVEEAVLFASLEAFEPDLVVFDTHAPMRVVMRLPEIGARSVLILRELRPEAMTSFLSNGAVWFDRLVVPHEPREVADASIFAGTPVAIVGPIVRAAVARLRVDEYSEGGGGMSAHEKAERAPRPSRSSPGMTILAMMGGGGQPVDARRYAQAVADAHLLARARFPELQTILVTGPYGCAPEADFAGLEIRRSVDDLPALLSTATLVISQAGYNAIAEIRAHHKPAILVPGHRKAEDQRLRARRLVRSNAAVLARPEARSIANRIETLLGSPEALERMREGHRRAPLVPKNREAAEAILRPIHRPTTKSARVQKVVLVAHDFAPKLGGMETVARSLAERLLARGIDVRVYTTKRLGAARTSLGPEVVTPLYDARPPPGRIDLWNDLLLTIDALLRDAPDVVHLCHAGLAPWVPVLRAAFPASVTVHVHGNDLLTPWVHHGGDVDAYRAQLTDGLREADAVLAVSNFSRSLVAAAAHAEPHVHTVENGVDAERFRPLPSSDDRERFGLDSTDEVLLTVSRLAPRKGHRTVLRALAQLARKRPRLKFVFTGKSDVLRAEILALAKDLGVADRVIPLGFVSENELPALYNAADAFLLLAEDVESDVEGFGVALLEAASCGLPTIASRTGGMPEAIVDGHTGLLVAPGDPGDAARAIDWVFEQRTAAKALGVNGRARVLDAFSSDRTTDKILAIWSAIPSRTLARSPETLEHIRRAQRHSASIRAERARRRTTFRDVAARGQVVRLRATGDGARLLPEALDDCTALGLRPRVEVKLRRFLEADFLEHALPLLSDVELAHGVPHIGSDSIFAALKALPTSALDRVRIVRLFLTPDARLDLRLAVSAVPEAHALRRWFSDHGAVVVPPPELMRYLSETPANGPETGMVEPTNLCNLACPTCPTGTGKIKPLPQMTLARFDRVLEALTPSRRLKNLALWNYGEPLLNRELPAMIAHAKQAGVNVVKVSSNVHFLDGARGRALLESGLDVLILSVDGASQATYATFRKDGDFDKVAQSVAWLCAEKKRLKLEKPRIELQFIAMRHNEHELPEMQRLAREWGVDRLRVKTVGADDDETRDLVPASRLLSRYETDGRTPNVRHAFCTMAWDHTVVNVDGSVTPCCYLRPDMGDAFVMGNVFDTPWSEIWRGEKYRAFRAAMLAGRATMPICDRCRGGTHDLIAAQYEVS